jgi:hypothetical protein
MHGGIVAFSYGQCNNRVCIRCRAQDEKELCDAGDDREEADRIEAQGGTPCRRTR